MTAFGAFVDIGVHQDGLVHISQLSDQFVKDPNEVVKVGQRVQVTVMELDLDRNRISLSMKSRPELGSRQLHPAGQPREARMGGPSSRGSFSNNPFADAFNKPGNK